jgi:hypothetical protein
VLKLEILWRWKTGKDVTMKQWEYAPHCIPQYVYDGILECLCDFVDNESAHSRPFRDRPPPGR